MIRHFAFDPGNESIEDGHRDIVVMPEQALGQLVFYLQTMLLDLTVSLLQRLDGLAQEIGVMSEIPSPRDFDSSLPREVKARIHLRYAGRRLKLMGDLYLMAGAYEEAAGSLVAASEETKATGDHLWHAGSQEALQLVLAVKNHVALLDDDEHERARRDLWVSVPLRLREAAASYERTVMPRLAFQVQLQAADLCTRLLGDTGQAATALVLGWNGCGPLNVYEKLVVLAEMICRFEALKLFRKAALYRKRLVFHLCNLEENQAASQLMTFLVQYYSDSSSLLPAILDQALGLAETLHDHRLVVELALRRLACDPAVMSTSEQEEYKARIKACARKLRPAGPIQMCLPSVLVVQCTAVGAEDARIVKPVEEGRKSPMVYMPQSRASKSSVEVKRMIGIQEEPIALHISLGNPFAFTLTVKQLILSDGASGVSSDPIDLVLDPLEKAHHITAFLTPKLTGQLTVSRLDCQLFGVVGLSLELDNPLLFQVHPAQPLLVAQQLPRSLDLLSGETVTLQIPLQRVFDVAPNHLQVVQCTGGASVTSELSGQSNVISVCILGRTGETEAAVQIEYARKDKERESDPFLVRTLSITIPLTVKPVLILHRVRFDPGLEEGMCTAVLTVENEADFPLFLRSSQQSEELVLGPFLTRTLSMGLQRLHVHSDASQLTDQQVVDLRNRSTPASPQSSSPHTLDSLVVEKFVLIERLKREFKVCWRTAEGRYGELELTDEHLDFDRIPLESLRAPPVTFNTEWRVQDGSEWHLITEPSDKILCLNMVTIELRFTTASEPRMACRLELTPSVPTLSDYTKAIVIGGQLHRTLEIGDLSELRILLVPLTRTLLRLQRTLRGLDDNRLLTTSALSIHFT